METGGNLVSSKVSVTSKELSGRMCPMVECGQRVHDLRGHCLQKHVPEVFRDLSRTGEDLGRLRASALQTILRVLGGSGGPLCVCRRTAGHYWVPGGS